MDITDHTIAYIHVDYLCDTLYHSIHPFVYCVCKLLRRYLFGELVRLRPNECSLFIAAFVRYCFMFYMYFACITVIIF